MNLSKKDYVIFTIALIIIIFALIKFSTNKKLGTPEKQTSLENQNPKLNPTKNNLEQTITGKLTVSDNKKRGNLMLITDKQTIYLSTGRDYSKFINTQVNLQIKGTPDNFSLIDIIAK